MSGMQFHVNGLGLSQFYNDDVVLAGGIRTGKPGTEGTARLKYTAYDRRAMNRGIPAQEAELGTLEINVRPHDGSIEGLVDLTIKRALRGQGFGRRVVEAVAATSPEGLKVYDIKASARGFWAAVGCEIAPKAKGRQQDGAMAAPEPVPEAVQSGPGR